MYRHAVYMISSLLMSCTFPEAQKVGVNFYEGQRLSSEQSFVEDVGRCASGFGIKIDSDLSGSLNSSLYGSNTEGFLTFDLESFLSLFPEERRHEVFAIYSKCIEQQTYAKLDRDNNLLIPKSKVQGFSVATGDAGANIKKFENIFDPLRCYPLESLSEIDTLIVGDGTRFCDSNNRTVILFKVSIYMNHRVPRYNIWGSRDGMKILNYYANGAVKIDSAFQDDIWIGNINGGNIEEYDLILPKGKRRKIQAIDVNLDAGKLGDESDDTYYARFLLF